MPGPATPATAPASAAGTGGETALASSGTGRGQGGIRRRGGAGGGAPIASEEPEHDEETHRKTRQQLMEELALEYFRNRPRYQVWKLAVVLVVAAALTVVYVKYKTSIHTAGEQLRDNFGSWPLMGEQPAAVPIHTACSEFSESGERGCASGQGSWVPISQDSAGGGGGGVTRAQCRLRCDIALAEAAAAAAARVRGPSSTQPPPRRLCCYHSDELGCAAKLGAGPSQDPGDRGDVAECTVVATATGAATPPAAAAVVGGAGGGAVAGSAAERDATGTS